MNQSRYAEIVHEAAKRKLATRKIRRSDFCKGAHDPVSWHVYKRWLHKRPIDLILDRSIPPALQLWTSDIIGHLIKHGVFSVEPPGLFEALMKHGREEFIVCVAVEEGFLKEGMLR